MGKCRKRPIRATSKTEFRVEHLCKRQLKWDRKWLKCSIRELKYDYL